jgi:7-cyano-7-deazaguanine reductase
MMEDFFFTCRSELGNILSMKYGTKAVKESKLEIWDNPNPDRDYTIEISYPEFTCLCPRSGYPDFATMKITYVPNRKIVELKALKLWLNGFRDQSISHEAVTNRIFDVLNKGLKPRSLEVVGDFNVRGNVKTVVRVTL